MELWNIRYLKPPPTNSIKSHSSEIDTIRLHDILNEGYNYFAKNELLKTETHLLSRCIYRMKLQLRSSKDLHVLKKLQKALHNYYEMDFHGYIKTFQNLVPERTVSNTYLPTRNMLEYILVRLQALTQVFDRIIEIAKIAGNILNKRINLGHFWRIALINLAVVSRIFVLARHVIKFSCDFYSKLYVFLSKLSSAKTNWLPNDYSLPKDLKNWLNLTWLDEEDQVIEIPDDKDVTKYLDFINLEDDDDDDVVYCNEYLIGENERNFLSSHKSQIEKNKKDSRLLFDDVDAGEIIEIQDSIYDLPEERNIEHESVTENNEIIDHTRKLGKFNKTTPKEEDSIILVPPEEEEDIGEIINICDFQNGNLTTVQNNLSLGEVINIPDETIQVQDKIDLDMYISDDSGAEVIEINDPPKTRKQKKKAKLRIPNNKTLTNQFISLDLTPTKKDLKNNNDSGGEVIEINYSPKTRNQKLSPKRKKVKEKRHITATTEFISLDLTPTKNNLKNNNWCESVSLLEENNLNSSNNIQSNRKSNNIFSSTLLEVKTPKLNRKRKLNDELLNNNCSAVKRKKIQKAKTEGNKVESTVSKKKKKGKKKQTLNKQGKPIKKKHKHRYFNLVE